MTRVLPLLLAAALLAGCGNGDGCEVEVRVESSEDGATVLVACGEVARSEADRIKGLSGRESLAEGDALVLESPVEDTFCITNEPVVFPIDAVFVSESGQVVAIERAIPAGESGYRCHDGVRRVVELAADVASGVEPLDLAHFE